ncbi:endonuclease/exonuclease/phosphatase family protein [Nocardioides sp. Soil805]|uniref:endonuclease/exonuclease/phosphatase family protein n=1 Tax=Nocardioides sp. Soil805 TaxID=1736416 RepID=UPI0007032E61|nr:endonuclease/exonuclease/phosphatase family protein [Nocardioides sp. Soil805]KRF35314.1 endonuclease [Nocardioides sp. Soil805]
MRRTTLGRTTLLGAGLVTALAAGALAPAQADRGPDHGPRHGETVRFSTFNASLNRATAGGLAADLSTPDADTGAVRQAHNVAETIQRTRPDVLLVNEFDHDPAAVDLFRDNFLEVGHHGAAPIEYPYAYTAPSNTGIPSGHDLNNNGVVGEPGTQAGGDDAFGFGLFPGQYGMVVYSKYPIDTDDVRTFQTFRWADMPGALLPDDPATPAPADWYSPDELEDFRLSSKSHWDVPIEVGDETVHFLVSHPTPPTFDGAEDRNGTRNHDEIRFWADYVSASKKRSAYIYDDDGVYGGLERGSRFVIAGDQNADPEDGDSVDAAIDQLLDHPRVVDPEPTSDGGVEAAGQGGNNALHSGDPALDTADFGDVGAFGPGNLRVDYVLPSKGTKVLGSGIFWPVDSDPLYYLTGDYDPTRWPFTGVPTSDHRQVWVDLRY